MFVFDQEEAADTGLNALLLDEYKLDPFEHGTCVSAVRLFDESQDSIDAHNEGSRVTVVPPRTTIRGRNLIAVGTTTMPFRGEEERSGGRVLLFRVESGKLEVVSILLLDDPVMGVSDLTMTAKEMHRCRKARYVKSVFMIHVGGTRCVPSSTANIMKIHARITLTVEFIRTCIFLF